MRRGKCIGVWERLAIIEALARQFYALQGCNAPDEPRDYMEKSTHPQEKACYAMAVMAADKFML